MPTHLQAALKVADEVWTATLQLHRERPTEPDFTIEEIIQKVVSMHLSPTLRPGVYVHVVQHCVANRPPNPGRYRMLVETAPGRRRLFCEGDPYHPQREGGKTRPNPDGLPSEYSGFLDAYRDWCAKRQSSRVASDPLLALYGSGRELWREEPADDYIRRLRGEWE